MDAALTAIGVVRSSIRRRADAPKQGDEGGVEARIEIDPGYRDAVDGLEAGQEILLLTWLHEADRETLRVHPRSDPARPLTGVFATRSPDRPNPIGVHQVRVVAIEGGTLRVAPLEAIDGTPVIDIKPILCGDR